MNINDEHSKTEICLTRAFLTWQCKTADVWAWFRNVHMQNVYNIPQYRVNARTKTGHQVQETVHLHAIIVGWGIDWGKYQYDVPKSKAISITGTWKRLKTNWTLSGFRLNNWTIKPNTQSNRASGVRRWDDLPEGQELNLPREMSDCSLILFSSTAAGAVDTKAVLTKLSSYFRQR